jgi:hypothetical protein
MADLGLEGTEKDLVDAMIDAMDRPRPLSRRSQKPKFVAVMAGGRLGISSCWAHSFIARGRLDRDLIGSSILRP